MARYAADTSRRFGEMRRMRVVKCRVLEFGWHLGGIFFWRQELLTSLCGYIDLFIYK